MQARTWQPSPSTQERTGFGVSKLHAAMLWSHHVALSSILSIGVWLHVAAISSIIHILRITVWSQRVAGRGSPEASPAKAQQLSTNTCRGRWRWTLSVADLLTLFCFCRSISRCWCYLTLHSTLSIWTVLVKETVFRDFWKLNPPIHIL